MMIRASVPRIPVLALAALVCLSGCSIKNVKIDRVALCSGGECSPASPESKERLLGRIYNLLRSAKKTDIRFYRSKSKTRARGRRGVRFYTLSTLLPLPGKLSYIRLDDVLYVDREKSEIKLVARPRSSFLFVPPACTKGSGMLKVHSPTDIRLEVKAVCSWLVLPFGVKLDIRIDSIDFEARAFSGYYRLGFRGLAAGVGRGYFRAELAPSPPPPPAPKKEKKKRKEPPKAPAVAAKPPPLPKPPVPPKPPAPVEVEEEIISELPVLALRTRFEDENGDLILEGGEKVTLNVSVENVGRASAEDVRVALSGSPELVAALGEGRGLGRVSLKRPERVVFEGRLAQELPVGAAELRIEVLAGRGGALTAAKVLKVAMRPGAVEAAEEVLSEISVDDIPPKIEGAGRPNDAALVVGISDYREKFIPKVKYAGRDAEIMVRYLENVAGVPPANIKLLTDSMATKSDLEAYLEDWLARRVKEDSTVYFYYAGHGAPAPDGKEAYLVPYEGHPDFSAKLFGLKRLYASLKKLNAKRTVVMLDSCFSGASGRGITSQGARPLVFVALPRLKGADVVVMSAASGSQISSDYDKVEHGLFTYYLLKGMRGGADEDRDGSVSLGELFQYVRANVSETASLELNRDQIPELMPPLSEASPHTDLPVVQRYR
ncbi:MAG: caspase family protein [Elusimicrobiota bacterium]